MFNQNRNHRSGGGVALYVRKELNVKLVNSLTMAVNNVFECVTVEIIMDKRKNMLISCIYKAPGADMEVFIEHMEKMFRNYNHKDIHICGDFNIDLLKAKSHRPTGKFVDTMYSLSLYPVIIRPTRITAHCATLIDNIFTNNLNTTISSGLLVNDITDHLPIFNF